MGEHHGRVVAAIVAALVLLPGGLAACRSRTGAAGAPVAAMHYAANGNFASDGTYRPGRLGFNLADVGTREQLDALPAGARGLVYLGLCNGADAGFRSDIAAFAGARRLFGFYLVDEPDPASCPAAHLAAESAYIHAQVPGARTFVLVQNLASSRQPNYRGGYDRANTGIDLFGIDPYPCRSELGGCDYPMVERYVTAAESAGIPTAAIVPVYQAFGAGTWVDDGGGRWVQPTPPQATQLLRTWARLIPRPVFDYVYSWGEQRGDRALAVAPAALQRVFAAHNHGS